MRPYREQDRAALYDVCVRTGAAGGDARGRHGDDELLGDVWLGPYLHLEPELAFVLDDGGRAVGYCVGTASTARFVRDYRDVWIPHLGSRRPVPPAPPRTPDEEVLALHHDPERLLVPELADHPAHLHVDLLPSHQGAGHGRALVHAFLAAARRAGARAVHLGVAAENTRARAFYARLGFTALPVPGAVPGTVLGRSTA
ncbi:GNAT family N-acetyltransferase [Pseudokineococcus sp. 5B2Z-1]|uniref:GNAT family N-acetyltransferase n=1 Tax=Pseudokineococcus sp. 5B2Z-1 TaxID=3132744 RepID=UPI003096C36E